MNLSKAEMKKAISKYLRESYSQKEIAEMLIDAWTKVGDEVGNEEKLQELFMNTFIEEHV